MCCVVCSPFDVGETPFLVATLPSDDVAREIARRAVLVTSVCQLWGYGPDIDEVRGRYTAGRGSDDVTSFLMGVQG